jgi:hypothetical protein
LQESAARDASENKGRVALSPRFFLCFSPGTSNVPNTIDGISGYCHGRRAMFSRSSILVDCF